MYVRAFKGTSTRLVFQIEGGNKEGAAMFGSISKSHDLGTRLVLFMAGMSVAWWCADRRVQMPIQSSSQVALSSPDLR